MDRYTARLIEQLNRAIAKGDIAAATMLRARIDQAKAGR